MNPHNLGKGIVAVAAAVVVAVFTLAPSPSVSPSPSPAAPELTMVAGTVQRASLTTWVVISDTTHTSVNIASVEIVANNRLRVWFDFTADQVVTFSVTADETFAKYPVTCGASVGIEYADIYCYMPGSQTPINPGLLSVSGANLWIEGFLLVAPQ